MKCGHFINKVITTIFKHKHNTSLKTTSLWNYSCFEGYLRNIKWSKRKEWHTQDARGRPKDLYKNLDLVEQKTKVTNETMKLLDEWIIKGHTKGFPNLQVVALILWLDLTNNQSLKLLQVMSVKLGKWV